MPQSDPSKTEKATPKRRQKARNEGNVPRSQELSKLVVLLIGLVFLRLGIGFIGERIKGIYVWTFEHGVHMGTSPSEINSLFHILLKEMAIICVPLFLSLAVVAYVINIAQFGRLWTTKPLQPKFSKMLNIIGGLQRMFFNTQMFVNLAKSIGSAVAVGIAPYFIIKNEFPNLLPLFYQTPEGVAVFILSLSFQMCVYAFLPMIIIAAADTFYTRWEYEENLKMTKDEIKDEAKQAEGDPEVKQKQKQKMLEMSAKRMLASVPKADVVVVNPTHYAVALSYDALVAPAPVVLAKGVDHLALKIREIAAENNVPIRENKPLARALYEQTEVGDVIPEAMYKAVATLLARLGRFKKTRTIHP
jgi:flagellar biosynthetic protein FlhB